MVFGAGSFERVGEEAAAFGRRALVVTGARFLHRSPWWPRLVAMLETAGLAWRPLAVEGEPSPELVEEAVLALRGRRVEVVIAIGGGSVLDAGKAIAGLLEAETSLFDHLEGSAAASPTAVRPCRWWRCRPPPAPAPRRP